jgi:hypothetical protein
MSALFQAPTGRSPRVTDAAATIADHTGRPGRYLTDGVDLYRFLGAVPSGMGELVGLEDCRSLEATLLPTSELHARRLCAVTPAAQVPAPCDQ